jgi:hypothetical protein
LTAEAAFAGHNGFSLSDEWVLFETHFQNVMRSAWTARAAIGLEWMSSTRRAVPPREGVPAMHGGLRPLFRAGRDRPTSDQGQNRPSESLCA